MCSNGKACVSMTKSIEICCRPEAVFDYTSNLSNDPYWRPEVASMELNGETKVGAIAVERITIYRYFNFVTPVVLKVLDRPTTFVAESLPEHPYWVECVRTVSSLDKSRVLFTVKLSFSLDNLRQILPVLPPAFIVSWWYVPRIKKYLNNLKRILESNTSA